MTLSTITIISLLLALYGLVAIIRDIVVVVINIIKKRAANKAYKEFIKDFRDAFNSMPEHDFSKIAIGEKAFYFGNGEGDSSCDGEECGKGLPTMAFSSNSPKPKRKYNKSGKHKKVTKKTK